MNKPDAQANDRPEKNEPETMSENSFWRDFLVSLAFLSRLPVSTLPVSTAYGFSLASASRAFGLTGIFIGSITGAVFWLVNSAGPGAVVAILCALAINTLLTGGLHEDGLADVADGFGGGWTQERKLEIMRDSNIGTFGVLALIFTVGLRATTYVAILGSQSGLLETIALFAGVACLSRGAMALMMYQLPMARKDGRAVQAGSPSHDGLRQGLFVSAIGGGGLLAVTAGGLASIAAFAGVISAYLIVSRLARRQIGGYTGDVLGTLQQIAEILALVAITAII